MKGPAGSPFLTLVAAVAEDGTIGLRGRLPWSLPLDQARFKDLTWGHVVLMGRRTWESLPKRPLPGRENVVLSRQAGYAAPGARTARSLEEALAASGAAPVFVIGGAEVFAETIGRADRLVLTRVPGCYGGDARFPPVPEGFRRVSREEVGGPAPFAVEVWERAGRYSDGPLPPEKARRKPQRERAPAAASPRSERAMGKEASPTRTSRP